MKCRNCKEDTVTIYMKKGPHFGGYCKECGTLKKWVSSNVIPLNEVKQTRNKPLI